METRKHQCDSLVMGQEKRQLRGEANGSFTNPSIRCLTFIMGEVVRNRLPKIPQLAFPPIGEATRRLRSPATSYF